MPGADLAQLLIRATKWQAGRAVREGAALLQGLAVCGHCGRRLRTHYRGRNVRPGYHCPGKSVVEGRGQYCLNVGGCQIDAAAKTAAYSLASDVRAAAYPGAEQRHRDRMAAIQRHFGQQVMSRGDPDADHALDFVETDADPERLFAPFPAEAPIGRVVEIDYTASSPGGGGSG
jgi:hypothetical protein